MRSIDPNSDPLSAPSRAFSLPERDSTQTTSGDGCGLGAEVSGWVMELSPPKDHQELVRKSTSEDGPHSTHHHHLSVKETKQRKGIPIPQPHPPSSIVQTTFEETESSSSSSTEVNGLIGNRPPSSTSSSYAIQCGSQSRHVYNHNPPIAKSARTLLSDTQSITSSGWASESTHPTGAPRLQALTANLWSGVSQLQKMAQNTSFIRGSKEGKRSELRDLCAQWLSEQGTWPYDHQSTHTSPFLTPNSQTPSADRITVPDAAPNESFALVLMRAAAIANGMLSPASGTLVVSNYRLTLLLTRRLPSSLQWIKSQGYLDIPLGCVERLETSCVKVPLSYGVLSDVLVLEIRTKDSRNIKFLVFEGRRNQEICDYLHHVMFPPTCLEGYCFQSRHSAASPADPTSLISTPMSLSQTASGSGAHRLMGSTYRDYGWEFYDAVEEYHRMMGLTSPAGSGRRQSRPNDENLMENEIVRVSVINEDYGLCESYPRYIAVPRTMKNSQLHRIAKFRTMGRIPVLSWMRAGSPGTIWRSSQPRSVFNRCKDDEELISEIQKSGRGPLLILDARPYMNAWANKMAGNGFEDMENYPRCELAFGNIHNIHKVSGCWERTFQTLMRLNTDSYIPVPGATGGDPLPMTDTATPPGSPTAPPSRSWGPTAFEDDERGGDALHEEVEGQQGQEDESAKVEGSVSKGWSQIAQLSHPHWYDHIATLLRAANRVTAKVAQGDSVLVHCSDGWDRTPQISSLAMMALDPFYRTLKGFILLIEKEFLSFGHLFHSRCGLPGAHHHHHRHGGDDKHSSSLRPEMDNEVQGAPRVGMMSREVASLRHTETHATGPPQPTASTPTHRNLSQRATAKQSPVFIQWLDCVYQYWNQHPSEFEFTPQLLLFISHHVYSCRYGTFLFNSEKERLAHNVDRYCYSLWTDVIHPASQSPESHSPHSPHSPSSSSKHLSGCPCSRFLNPLYSPLSNPPLSTSFDRGDISFSSTSPVKASAGAPPLYVQIDPFRVHFWIDYWLRFHPYSGTVIDDDLNGLSLSTAPHTSWMATRESPQHQPHPINHPDHSIESRCSRQAMGVIPGSVRAAFEKQKERVRYLEARVKALEYELKGGYG